MYATANHLCVEMRSCTLAEEAIRSRAPKARARVGARRIRIDGGESAGSSSGPTEALSVSERWFFTSPLEFLIY